MMQIPGKKKSRNLKQNYNQSRTPPTSLPEPQEKLSVPDRIEQDHRGFCLDKSQPFSQSLLWTLQRDYFTQRGLNAWSQGEVPHYITNNPTIATAYAEIVFACWQDRTRHLTSTQPFYLCELGAGSGRFAFHFLLHLTHLCHQHQIPPTHFRYILTDFAQANLDTWHRHPQFRPFFQQGILDTALFDSIPQDLYYINNGQIQTCLVSLFCDQNPKTFSPAQLLDRIHLHYDYQPTNLTHLDPQIQSLLRHCQHHLTDTHLLVPTTGLLCLKRLQVLSQEGLLLLSADKGKIDLSTLQGNRPPGLVTHQGCFSLSVNYALLKTFCEQQGGIALTPSTNPQSLCVVALIMGDRPKGYHQTQLAYDRYVRAFGPDDFFRITKHVRQTLDQMSVADILAYLRLSYYDSHQFARYLPRLQQLAPSFTPQEHATVMAAIEEVWHRYFPIGEENNLSLKIANFCFQLQEDDRAHQYLEQEKEREFGSPIS